MRKQQQRLVARLGAVETMVQGGLSGGLLLSAPSEITISARLG